MSDLLQEYEKLARQSACKTIPGTSVPGHGIQADGIGPPVMGTDASGVMSEAIGPWVTVVPADGVAAGTNDARAQHAGIPSGSGVKADAVDGRTMSTGISSGTGIKSDAVDARTIVSGESMDGCKVPDPKDGSNNKNVPPPEEQPVPDDFGKLPRRLQVFALAEEAAANVEIVRLHGIPHYYDSVQNICVRINPKPSPDGNITKLLRDNVSGLHVPYVDDGIAKAVFSWWCDSGSIQEVRNFNKEHLVAFNDGYFDMEADCFVKCTPHDLGFYFTTKVNTDYTDRPPDPLVMDIMRNTYKEDPKYIFASCGVMHSYFRDFKKAFFYVGPSDSGKTTLTNFQAGVSFPSRKDKADRMESAVRAVSLKRLGGRFSPAVLMDAHYSWSGDVGAAEFTRPAFDNFKLLTGRDEFEAENKFKTLRIEKPRCVLAFNCNTCPRFPLAWDYDGTGDIDDGAGRSRCVIFHTKQKITEEMQQEFKKKHGKTVDQVLMDDKDAITSEMIRQAGRFYRGEMLFPEASFEEVYSEGKTLKERFFYFVETQYPPTANSKDIVPLQKMIAGYKDFHPEEVLPYKDPIAEERGFGAMLNYVCKLDPRYEQAKKKVPGFPNPVSCLVGCRFQDSKKKEKS